VRKPRVLRSTDYYYVQIKRPSAYGVLRHIASQLRNMQARGGVIQHQCQFDEYSGWPDVRLLDPKCYAIILES
jgi:hypothetical protein